ncbi:MAG TPA: hypothetical protein VFV38_09815 [Ktedonobacteraceae bacterium]|nr:hypothetical protein [Ktedonobacteraceae bacterium]
MMLFEAMQHFLNTPFPLLHTQFSETERKRAIQTFQALRQAEEILSQMSEYERLSQEEGGILAQQALTLSEREDIDEEFRFVPHQVLENIANAVPGALRGLYPRFLQRDFSYGMEALFREADSDTRDQLILWIENEEKTVYLRDQLLSLLAWIDDEVVLKAFHRWRDNPPAWVEFLPQSVEWFPLVAGWELTADGNKRNLYYSTNYRLIPSDLQRSEQAEPVEMILPHEERCGWCHRSFVTLFDLQLSDRRLSFLSLQGERLRIAICPNCSQQDCQVITDIDMQGGSQWSASSGEAPERLHLYADTMLEKMTLPSRPLVLGSPHRTPFVSEGSHLGGCPGWVHYPEYPQCPQCQQTMTFLGQYEPDGVPYIEGIFFAFLCADCGKATTVYQQT